MNSAQFYEKMLAELEAGQRKKIARKIFKALAESADGLTRQQLIYIVFERAARANLANDPGDRKIRDTIQSMRARLIPIVSTSRQAGYKLDESPDAKKAMLAEWIGRRDALDEQIRTASVVWKVPVPYTDPEKATQVRLI